MLLVGHMAVLVHEGGIGVSDRLRSEVLCGGHPGLQGPEGRPPAESELARAWARRSLSFGRQNAQRKHLRWPKGEISAWSRVRAEWSQNLLQPASMSVKRVGQNMWSKRTGVAAQLVVLKSKDEDL